MDRAATKLVLDDLGPFVKVRGHRLWQTGPYVWCSLCGSHAHLSVRGLAEPCRGSIPSRAASGAWRNRSWKRANLAAGRAPCAKVQDAPIGTPARLTLEQLGWAGLLPEPFAGEEGAKQLSKALEHVVGDVPAPMGEGVHMQATGSLRR